MPRTNEGGVDIGLLQTNFLLGRRHFRVRSEPHVLDYRTIIETLERHGAQDIDRPEIIVPEGTGRVLDRREQLALTFDVPADVDYYMFAESNREAVTPKITLYELEDVTMTFSSATPSRPEFYIFDSSKRLVNNLFFGGRARYREPGISLPGTTIFADDFFVKPNICHLIFDKLPRSHWGARFAPDARHAVLFSYPYASDLYGALGHDLIGLTEITSNDAVHFERLILATTSFGALRHPAQLGRDLSRDAMAQMRKELGIAGTTGGDRMLMLDRQSTGKRAVVNWDHFIARLGEAEIEAYDPGAFAFADQVEMLRRCRLLIGVHGAGLTNLVYMPEDSAIIEILPPWSATTSFWQGAMTVDRRYEAVVAHDAEGREHDQNTQDRDRSQHRNSVRISDEQIDRIIALSKELGA